ncbi:hypothetical protein [Levilactobacillus brevis]|uniref:hypothetical protein n=1 Tax=Levilactobacillus brevis TaxID=1580 RepID=UPI0035A2CB9D
MNKLRTSILIATATVSLSLFAPTLNQPAQAATWHKGMPKALRGKWSHSVKKFPKYMGIKGSGTYRLTIVKKAFVNSYFTKKNKELAPEIFLANPQYKKISKTTYRLQGGHGNSGMSSGYGHHDPIQIVKQGNKIKYKYSWSSHVKYSTWFYKM